LNKNICSKAHPAGTDVTIFKLFSAKNLVKIFAFFAQTTAGFCKNIIITLVFEKKKHQFFRRKLAKIAEKCDNNIDPSRTRNEITKFITVIFSLSGTKFPKSPTYVQFADCPDVKPEIPAALKI
jgi:hypothetical protein